MITRDRLGRFASKGGTKGIKPGTLINKMKDLKERNHERTPLKSKMGGDDPGTKGNAPQKRKLKSKFQAYYQYGRRG